MANTNNMVAIVTKVLKDLNIPFTDPCDPDYTGECCAVDTVLECSEVISCLAPITGAGDITVTGDYATGFVVSFTDVDTPHLTCEDVANCFGGITSNTITVGGDFETGFTLEFVESITTLTGIVDTITDPANPTIVLTYVNENASNPVINIPLGVLLDNTDTQLTCAEVASCFGGVTSTGATVIVTGDFLNGFNLEIIPPVIVSTDVDQIITTGTDGGALLTCDVVNGCVVTTADVTITNPNTGLPIVIPTGTTFQEAVNQLANMIVTTEVTINNATTAWDAANLTLTLNETDGDSVVVNFNSLVSSVISNTAGLEVTPTTNVNGSITYTLTLDLCEVINDITDNGNTALATDKFVTTDGITCELKTINFENVLYVDELTLSPTFPTDPIEGNTYINNAGSWTFDGAAWIIDPQAKPFDKLCDPNNDNAVVFIVLNADNTFTYLNADNTPYTGIIADLIDCCCVSPEPVLTDITSTITNPFDVNDAVLDCTLYNVGDTLFIGTNTLCPDFVYQVFSDGAGGCVIKMITKPDGASSNFGG